MSWGTMMVGRLFLSEVHRLTEQINAQTRERTLSIGGLEYSGRRGIIDPMEAIADRQEDVLGLAGQYLPIVFERKTEQTGFYEVHDVNVEGTKWSGHAQFFGWSMILRKIGPENAVDVESRMGTVVRLNDFTLTGERWHAPPIGHVGYYTGSTLPSSTFTRSSSDGSITVYRGIPADTNPRWSVAAGSYALGRVRILTDARERNGAAIRVGASNWEMHNGLTRVRPLLAGGMLEVSTWGASGWESKAWNIARGGATTALGAFDSATVLRNDFEMGTIRLAKGHAPGRTLVDLTLRRGSRFLEVYVQTSVSSTLGLYLEATETATDSTASGYVVATGDDASGNRFIVGSSKTISYTANRGLSKAAVTALDGFIGVVHDGGAAVAGDGAIPIRDQYIGSVSESTAMVRR